MPYASGILRVNLTTNDISRETVPEEVTKHLVSGRGLGISQLYHKLCLALSSSVRIKNYFW